MTGFDGDGYCVIEDAIGPEEVERLVRFTEDQVARDDGRGGVRNLLDFPQTRALAQSRACTADRRPDTWA